jgi:hypothetical protein
VEFPDIKSLGNIEAAFFQPEAWKPEYPNQAFLNAQADDLFWAARKTMAISDDAIRAAVASAEYSEPAATAYLSDVIIARRDKIGLTWLNVVNPLVDFQLSRSGAFTSRNIAVDTRRALPAESYQARWGRFDNATGAVTAVGEAQSATLPTFQAPAGILDHDVVQIEISSASKTNPAWATPVRVRFRRAADGWQLVGVIRTPDQTGPVSSR